MSPERENRSETWLEQMVEYVFTYIVPIAFIVIAFVKILEDEQRMRGAGAISVAYLLMWYVIVMIRKAAKGGKKK